MSVAQTGVVSYPPAAQPQFLPAAPLPSPAVRVISLRPMFDGADYCSLCTQQNAVFNPASQATVPSAQNTPVEVECELKIPTRGKEREAKVTKGKKEAKATKGKTKAKDTKVPRSYLIKMHVPGSQPVRTRLSSFCVMIGGRRRHM